jgi:hypothetical protein
MPAKKHKQIVGPQKALNVVAIWLPSHGNFEEVTQIHNNIASSLIHHLYDIFVVHSTNPRHMCKRKMGNYKTESHHAYQETSVT